MNTRASTLTCRNAFSRAVRNNSTASTLQTLRSPRLVPGGTSAILNGLQVGQHHPPELGQMGVAPFSMEKRPAKFVLELLDGAGQRGLGNVAFFRGTREIQRARNREKIPNLLHFHAKWPSSVPYAMRRGRATAVKRYCAIITAAMVRAMLANAIHACG